MGILIATLGFGLVSLLLIESIPPTWRQAIGGAILLSALLLGCVPDH